MGPVDFTMTKKDIQNLIQQFIENDISKKILTTVFNQLIEQERCDYINTNDYERNDERVSYRNGYYARFYNQNRDTRI